MAWKAPKRYQLNATGGFDWHTGRGGSVGGSPSNTRVEVPAARSWNPVATSPSQQPPAAEQRTEEAAPPPNLEERDPAQQEASAVPFDGRDDAREGIPLHQTRGQEGVLKSGWEVIPPSKSTTDRSHTEDATPSISLQTGHG